MLYIFSFLIKIYNIYIHTLYICVCINSSLKQFEENENIFFSVKMFLGKIEIL